MQITSMEKESEVAGACKGIYVFLYPSFEDVASVRLLITCQQETFVLRKKRCSIAASIDELH